MVVVVVVVVVVEIIREDKSNIVTKATATKQTLPF